MGKAIFAFTATRPYNEEEIQQAYADWLPELEHALYDSLRPLIDACGEAVRNNPDAAIDNLDDLLDDLRKASRMRDVPSLAGQLGSGLLMVSPSLWGWLARAICASWKIRSKGAVG